MLPRRPRPHGRRPLFAARLGGARLTMAAAAIVAVAAGPGASAAATREEQLGSGAWSWFGDPRAVHHKGRHRRTYVGWISPRGEVQVMSYDHSSGERLTVTLRSGLRPDDHGNPSLLVRRDGRIMAFYSGRARRRMHYRVTTSPEDVSSWSRERAVPTNTRGKHGYTYPNPVQLAGGRRLFLFWRGGNFNPTFSHTSGGRWARARTLLRVRNSRRNNRPYLKVESDGRDTIHLAFTEGHPAGPRTSIHYAYYRRGRIHRADGRRITTTRRLPFEPRQADRVYDARRGRATSWVHDIALDANGRPVIVYAVIRSRLDHRYHYARWDGRRWLRHEIVPAGRHIGVLGTYSGGLSLDHEDASVVYLSREVAGVHEIERWQTPDGGASWTRTAVTSGSAEGNYRPVSPRGLRGGGLDVVWMSGRYRHYLDFATSIVTRPLGG